MRIIIVHDERYRKEQITLVRTTLIAVSKG